MANENENLKVTSGQNWTLQVDRAGSATLATEGKYLDRNIVVEVPKAEYDVTVSGEQKGSTIKPKVTVGIESEDANAITNAVTVTDIAPESGKYFVISAKGTETLSGSATVSYSATTSISKAGFLAKNAVITTDSKDTVVEAISTTITRDDAWYLPVSTITEDKITAASEHLSASDSNEAKDNLKVSITIPAGYYEQTTLTKEFSDLIPAIDDDATDEQILLGKKVYDENGNVITGTMANHASDLPLVQKVGDGTTTITGNTAITLSQTDDASGISITGFGEVDAFANIPATGYWVQSSSDAETYRSQSATKYITDIAVAADKTLNSISIAEDGTITTLTNSGSIETLNGNGTIEELAGVQTVESLTGTINIKTATDADPDSAESEGKIIFNDITLVQDGALKKAKSSLSGNTVTVTEGWVDKDNPINVGVDMGDYSVECTSTAPTVEYSVNTSLATSATATAYAISYGGSLKSAGSHTAKATITEGYIQGGSKSTDPEEIGIKDVEKEGILYIAEAGFDAKLSDTKYEDNEDVSQYYDVSTKDAGYTSAGIVESIPVFNGNYTWSL